MVHQIEGTRTETWSSNLQSFNERVKFKKFFLIENRYMNAKQANKVFEIYEEMKRNTMKPNRQTFEYLFRATGIDR